MLLLMLLIHAVIQTVLVVLNQRISILQSSQAPPYIFLAVNIVFRSEYMLIRCYLFALLYQS